LSVRALVTARLARALLVGLALAATTAPVKGEVVLRGALRRRDEV
jgi:hypothetical protein